MLLIAKEISGSGTVAEGLFVALPAGNEGKVAFSGILKSLEPGSWLFTGFISSLYSLYIHLTVAISMEYCQYTKSCLFSIVYGLVLLYVKEVLRKLPNRTFAVMLFLVANVVGNSRRIGHAHAECAITFLPSEFDSLLIHPF